MANADITERARKAAMEMYAVEWDDSDSVLVADAAIIARHYRELHQEQHEYFTEQLRRRDKGLERLRRYRTALENHLCKYDLADWLACAGGHAPETCIVCEQSGEHGHTLLTRAEKAEAAVAPLVEAARTLLQTYRALYPSDHPDSYLPESIRQMEAALRSYPAAGEGGKEND